LYTKGNLASAGDGRSGDQSNPASLLKEKILLGILVDEEGMRAGETFYSQDGPMWSMHDYL